MFKFYRSVLAAGVVAMGLAACGDDVTVGGGTTRGVTSVTVTPSSASVGVGQSIALAGSIVADSGISTVILWSTSNAAIATVSSAGVVTGVSVGTTTIVAKSQFDTTRTAAVQLTVLASAPGITSFTIAPQQITLAPGQSSQALATIVTAPGTTAPAVTWTSLTPAIATVSASGLITGVAQGTAVVTGTITSGGVTLTQTVNVTVGQGASISISSVTAAGTLVPVAVNNVAGQIDVNMNLNAGVQPLDSLEIYIKQGTRIVRGAGQVYGNTIPSAGPVTLSINTNRFTKNPTTGIALPDYFNGPVSLSVQVFPHNTAGGTVINCQTGASDPTCTGISSMIFNNIDGFAADLILPNVAANPAIPAGGFATSTASNPGQTYRGGPTPTGQTTAILYAVIYNDNPTFPAGSSTNRCNNVLGNGTGCTTSVTWYVGTPAANVFPNTGLTAGTGCAAVTQTTLPYKQVLGTGTGATNSCSTYQNITVSRDNIIVTASIDGSNNPFITVGNLTGTAPLATNIYATLIPSILATGGTPDSARIDYKAPTVTAPSVLGAEGLNWVNANYRFNTGGIADAGVGSADSVYAISFALASAPTAFTPFTTAASTPNNLPATGASLNETNTNVVTDGYIVRESGADRLGNTANSGNSAIFGVDKTSPVIRYSTTIAPSNFAASYTKGGAATVFDSTTYNAFEGLYGADVLTAGAQTRFIGTAAGNNDSVRTEALDARSGIYRALGSVVRFSVVGGPFTSGACAPTAVGTVGVCTTVANLNATTGATGFTLTTIDGYRILPALHVTGGLTLPGYYTTTEYVVDRAGNVSGCPQVGTTAAPVLVDGSICTSTTAATTVSSGASTTANTNPGLGYIGTAAGVNANLFVRRTLALDPIAPQVTGLTPAARYQGDSAAIFQLASQDDLEVIDARLRMEYRDSSNTTVNFLTIGDNGRTASKGLVYSYALSDGFLPSSPNSATGAGPTITSPTASPTASTVAFGYFAPVALRFDNSVKNPQTTNLTVDRLNISITETCLGAGSPVLPAGVTACSFAGDPIPATGANSLARVIPDSAAVRVRDVFGSFVFNVTPGNAFGVSTEVVNPILSATVLPISGTFNPFFVTYDLVNNVGGCPQGGNINGNCVTGTSTSLSINFRADAFLSGASGSTRVFRATEAVARTLPIFVRVDLFGLNAANEWVFVSRINVPTPVAISASCAGAVVAGTVQGCDNGFERYWLYSFTEPTVAAGTFSAYRALGVTAAGNGLFSTPIAP